MFLNIATLIYNASLGEVYPFTHICLLSYIFTVTYTRRSPPVIYSTTLSSIQRTVPI